MSIDTKALIAATPATVALVRRELDKSREAQRGGMQCSMPKAVKVDCAMVERLCRIAEKQADRLAALEASRQAMRQRARVLESQNEALEADNQRLREALDVIANLETDYPHDVAMKAIAAGGGQ